VTTDTIDIDDVGTSLRVTITEGGAVVDISAATDVEIELTKPGGTKVVKTAALLNDGTDGIIHYTTVSGDIDRKGTWSYRGIVTFSPTSKFHSIDPEEFIVGPIVA
tara:strand:+ start:228 stop:545 length:318 start_codon:yes stop_codon:yes gene_type:complete